MRKTKILIADSDAAATALLAAYVRRLGYEVTAAVCDGPAALEAAGHDPPDLALIDLHRVGASSGIELADRLPAVPVIFMSASPDDISLRLAKENGAYALLPKPFLAQDLRVALRAVLGRADWANASG